jgi:hypothetical protein
LNLASRIRLPSLAAALALPPDPLLGAASPQKHGEGHVGERLLRDHAEEHEAAVIGSPTWNWEHPVVLKQLKDVIAIDPDEIRGSIRKNNVAVLEFAGETYKRIYGRKPIFSHLAEPLRSAIRRTTSL